MLRKHLLLATLLFFGLHHSAFLWRKLPALPEMILTLLWLAGFVVLSVLLPVQLFFWIKEKGKDTGRGIAVFGLALVLGLSVWYPKGLVKADDFETKAVLEARWEGVASCSRILRLKADRCFVDRRVCFTVEEYSGRYQLAGDTIFFRYDRAPAGTAEPVYGLLRARPAGGGQLWWYENGHPRHPLTFVVTRNDIR